MPSKTDRPRPMEAIARTLPPNLRTAAWKLYVGGSVTVARPTAGWRVLPDYLIIGAQRCGTTSLQRIITQHPSVVPARLSKGVHYFDVNYHRGSAWYRAHFPTRKRVRAEGLIRLTGEASPYYLFHPRGPARIAAEVPDARLIVLLRDPVERAISHHKHETRRGFENLGLLDALSSEESRLEGEVTKLVDDDSHVSFAHQHYSYAARGMYYDQLISLYRHFPREQVLIIQSERFFSDPGPVYAKVLDFLGLERWDPPAYPHMNATQDADDQPEARRLLKNLYLEPNRELFELVGKNYQWV